MMQRSLIIDPDIMSYEKELRQAKFHIVAVPTPVNLDHTPDLTPVIGASETVGRNLVSGSIVGYESTAYPGGDGGCVHPYFGERIRVEMRV